MDLPLRCNSLKCRVQLSDRAVVTTCSHIFCLRCSDDLGLSQSNNGARVCPACETQLINPDDAVVTVLNPPEDYKTSVLSGLGPGIIMECAGRAMAFYTYQVTQEVIYQEYLAKSLTDKYTTLSGQMDKVIHEANTEIMSLREKLAATQTECKNLESKNHELAESYREKARSAQQVQKLYQNLKTQVMSSHVATAASDDAENALHFATINRFNDRPHSPVPQGPQGLGRRHTTENDQSFGGTGRYPTLGNGPGIWNAPGFGTRLYTPSSVLGTPTHRTRLPMANDRYPGDLVNSTPLARQPLSSLNANTFGNSGPNGYGLSAGMKVGKQPGGPLQRPAPGQSKLSQAFMR